MTVSSLWFRRTKQFCARYKTELETFAPSSTWSSGKWLVLLCKGLLV